MTTLIRWPAHKKLICLIISLAMISLITSADKALAAPKIIRLAAVGDIMLGWQTDEAAGAFAELAPYLKDRQVVIGNLEGPLTDRGTPTKVPEEGVAYVFRTPPHYAASRKQAGFTVMSLANNHANDYGLAGRQQTREVLDEAGILYTGAPGEVARQKIGRTTVSVIGLAPNKGCQDINDIPSAAALVRQEAAKANTLVVVFHGGSEGPDSIYVPVGLETYLGERRGDLRTLGRSLIDAGAHLVVGHGPHVPRGLEIYRDRLIAYSLGNFATGRGINSSGRGGLAPLLLVDINVKGQLVGGRVVSFRQATPGQVSRDETNEAAKLMHALSLNDFSRPGLDPKGNLVTTDSAALKMAATIPAPLKATAPELADSPEPEPSLTVALTGGLPVGTKQGQRGSARSASVGYEWDIYADLRAKL